MRGRISMSMTTLDVETDASLMIVSTDLKESVTIEGYCSRCGACCKPPVMRHPMFIIENTPVTNRSIFDGYCRYLTVDNKCKLFIAEEAADGSLDEYPVEHVTYWKERCKPWPTYDGKIPLEILKSYYAEGAFENCTFVVTFLK